MRKGRSTAFHILKRKPMPAPILSKGMISKDKIDVWYAGGDNSKAKTAQLDKVNF